MREWANRPALSGERSVPSFQPAPQVQLAAPGPSIQAAPPPARDSDAGAERLQIGLSRRRLWWIGGGISAVTLGAIVAALMIPSPEPPPGASDASDASATQAAGQTSGPRRDPRAAPPVDHAAADLRERVRLAREAAAAGVPMTASGPRRTCASGCAWRARRRPPGCR
jgi:hypothetical protein